LTRFARIALLLIALLCMSGMTWAAPEEVSPAQKRFARAMEYQQAGKLDEAAAEYRAVLKLQPNAVPAIINLGLIYEAKNDLSGAEAAFKRALAVDPKQRIALDEMVRLLMVRGKSRAALTYARKYTAAYPKDFRARFLTGVVYLRLQDYDKAVDAFRSAVQAKPGDISGMHNLAFAYFKDKRYKECLSTYDRLFKVKSDFGAARLTAGFAAEKIKRNDLAIKHYQVAAEDEAVAGEALANLARLYEVTGKDAKAVDALKKIARIEKNNYGINMALGRILLYKLKRYSEAESYLKLASLTKPGDYEAHLYLAVAQFQQKKMKEALSNVDTALKANPRSAYAFELKVAALESQSLFDKVALTLADWEKSNPKDPSPNARAARMHMLKGNLKAAAAEFEKALKKKPNDFALLSAYADVLRGDQQYPQAYDVYMRALKVKPDAMNATIGAAISLQQQAKTEEALVLLKKASEKAPKDEQVRVFIAGLYEEQEKPALAVAEYKKILGFAPKSVTAYANLARLYAAENKHDEAIAACQKLRELQPDNPDHILALIDALDNARRTDEAIETARDAATRDGAPTEFRQRLAQLYEKKPDLPNALAQYAMIAELKDADTRLTADALKSMARIQEQTGKPDEAIESLKKAALRDPGYADVYVELKRLFGARNDNDSYLAFLKSVAAASPSSAPYALIFGDYKAAGRAADAVAMFEEIDKTTPNMYGLHSALARAYTESGDQEKALASYLVALDTNKTDPALNKSAAAIYRGRQMDKQALERLEACRKHVGADKDYFLDLGGLYEKLGRRTDALGAYRDYLKIDPANQTVRNKVRDLETVDSSAPAPTQNSGG